VAAVAIVLCAAAIFESSSARASQLVSWTLTSRYVDPAKAQFNAPPPGVPARAPALRVDVLLPDGYNGIRAFPLLMLLHGHGDAFDYWVNPQKGDLLDIAPHFPGIVVMPDAAQGWYTDWWDGGARGTDGRAWERYFLDELMPMVMSRLRILPGRSNHAIAGLSMGGEGAIYLAEQLPGYFGAAASFSGVLSLQRPEWPIGFGTQGQQFQQVFGDPQAQRFYVTGHNPTALTDNLRYTRLFVRAGDGLALPVFPNELTNLAGAVSEVELAAHAIDFVTEANARGEDVTYQPTTGVHDWPYWRLALQAALQWGFFKPVTQAPPSWTYATVRKSGRAWDLSFSFARPPDTVETFVRQGDRLSATGSGVVTITGDGRPPFTAAVPFSRLLPAPLSRSTGRHRRRRAKRCVRVVGRGRHAHRRTVACHRH